MTPPSDLKGCPHVLSILSIVSGQREVQHANALPKTYHPHDLASGELGRCPGFLMYGLYSSLIGELNAKNTFIA